MLYIALGLHLRKQHIGDLESVPWLLYFRRSAMDILEKESYSVSNGHKHKRTIVACLVTGSEVFNALEKYYFC